MIATKNKQEISKVTIDPVNLGVATFWIKSRTSMLYPIALSETVKDRLRLAPNVYRHYTHDKDSPIEKYRSSVYQCSLDLETRLILPVAVFKCMLISAVRHRHVHVGITMAQMKQLVWVVGFEDAVAMYGIPKMHMRRVYLASMPKTADVVTRAILPEWCACVRVEYVKPYLNKTLLSRLLDVAGQLNGVGDLRSEKGTGHYGQFQVVSKHDCKELLKNSGRKAQDAALESPDMYDVETEEIYKLFQPELA